jgi:hypothetical protein
MYSVSNCHNVAKYTEFYLGYLRFNVTSTGNADCLKKSFILVWYSKCYCVVSVTKTFILNTLHAQHLRL